MIGVPFTRWLHVVQVYAGCMCEHSTTGQHCEQCAEAFNNVPWEGGTDAEANACESKPAVDCELCLYCIAWSPP